MKNNPFTARKLEELTEFFAMPGPSTPAIFKASGLNVYQFACSLRLPRRTVANLVSGKAKSRSVDHLAWLVWINYLYMDPIFGWIRSALLLPPRSDFSICQLIG